MIKIEAARLARLIDRVEPHSPTQGETEYLIGILLEAAQGWLHAVAVNPHAVARTEAEGDTWQAPIGAKELPALKAWLSGAKEIHLYCKPQIGRLPGLLVANAETASLMLPLRTDSEIAPWQEKFREHVHGDTVGLTDGPVMLRSVVLARWQSTGTKLNLWHAGGDAPVITTGDDFIGMQMPMRQAHPMSRGQLANLWADTLRDTRYFHDGTAYDTTVIYLDRHGDRWQFVADPDEHGEAMIVPENWDPTKEGFTLSRQ